MTQAHIIFSGTVQGVGFRLTAQRYAGNLNITGWVKNLPNGTVEIVAEGPKEEIEKLCLYIEGYFEGYVLNKKIEWNDAQGCFKDFKIAY